MSTSAVSSSSLSQQLQSYFKTRNSDVQQLGQALQSGNLTGAQAAYSTITSLAQGGPSAQGNAFLVAQRQQDFNAIGSALASGDLAGAQSAFAALKATANHGTIDPPVASGTTTTAGGAGPEIVLNLSAANGTSANPEQITINIAQGSGGAEQVQLSVGQGSSAQQVSFNLNSNSNEQIVLNLVNASSSSGTAATGTTTNSSASGGLSVSA